MPDDYPHVLMRVFRLLFLLLAVAPLVPEAASAKTQPPWLEASERHVLSTYFPGAHLTLVSVRPEAQRIRVIFEFRDVVACWRCTHPSGTAPEGRVVRVTFARATHRLSGAMKLCDPRGVTEPLLSCFS